MKTDEKEPVEEKMNIQEKERQGLKIASIRLPQRQWRWGARLTWKDWSWRESERDPLPAG